MNKPKQKVYGVTGHRPETMPFKGDHKAKFRYQELIREFVKTHPGVYIIGGARGFDTWVGLAALAEGYTVDIYLPFPEDMFTAKWFDPSDRPVLDDMINRARTLLIFSEEYSSKVYIERDREIVEKSDEMFAGYDGRSKGGTAATVGFTREAGKPLWVLDPSNMGAGAVRQRFSGRSRRPGSGSS